MGGGPRWPVAAVVGGEGGRVGVGEEGDDGEGDEGDDGDGGRRGEQDVAGVAKRPSSTALVQPSPQSTYVFECVRAISIETSRAIPHPTAQTVQPSHPHRHPCSDLIRKLWGSLSLPLSVSLVSVAVGSTPYSARAPRARCSTPAPAATAQMDGKGGKGKGNDDARKGKKGKGRQVRPAKSGLAVVPLPVC